MIEPTQTGEALKREMLRKSLDSYKVYNPTSKPYSLVWDKFVDVIPAKGYKVLPQFKAQKYAKEMCDIIINEKAQAFVDQQITKRAKAGMQALSPYERQELWDRAPKVSDENIIAEIYPTLIVGLVEEYGLGQVEQSIGEPTKSDGRSVQERIWDQLQQKLQSQPKTQDTPTVYADAVAEETK